MITRKIVLAMIAATALATSFSTSAWAGVDIEVTVAPPAPRYEVFPDARDGYVWISGYWGWDRHHHVWVEGHWVPQRRGYTYVPARWDAIDNRWHLRPGHWEREVVVVRRPGRREVIREEERHEERHEIRRE